RSSYLGWRIGRVWANPCGSLSAPLRSGAGPGRGDSPWDSPADPPRQQTGRRGSSRVTRGAGRVPGHTLLAKAVSRPTSQPHQPSPTSQKTQ
ncbi:hypothetical protein PSTT_16545, partial [Puccinia striiformis]